MSTTFPAVGTAAPAFSGKTQDGKILSLQDFAGRKLALYFYPEDDTPVCTRQACNLRDHFRLLTEYGVSIVGISPNSQSDHDAFIQKYALPFPLIEDPAHVILNQYGTWGEKNMYGNIVQGVLRYTFLIDEQGMIRHVFRKPKVDQHAQEILRKFGLIP